MRFLSVCSGIEAASVAWNPLGWKAAAFAEIEPFPCSVLSHHYPTVPNWGDMTKFQEWPDVAIDLLCGGTPCQSFSVAGLRAGLADPRGNLMLTYGAIAAKHRPRWLVWENVPGVLSSNGGRDFGSFLGLLGQLGYGFAYRVLDAQYFGVPQRRRRVFVVGCLGDWRSAAAVLFERHSLSGHPAPSRQAREGLAAATAPSLTASGRGVERCGESRGQDPVIAVHAPQIARSICTREGTSQDWETTAMVAHSLRGEGFDASEDGAGRGTPLVPVGVDGYNGTLTGEVAATMGTRGSSETASGPTVMSVALRGRDGGATAELGDEVGNALRASGGGGDKAHVLAAMQVRRLTPAECEALQGFPRNYTAIPHRGKPAADGPRYKALGNSWAVPCARWIGQRINEVEAIQLEKVAA